MIERLRRALRWEDVVLFLLGALLWPVLFAGDRAENADPLDPGAFWGFVYTIASIGALAALATRTAGEPVVDINRSDAMTPRTYAPLPFMAGLAIVADAGFGGIGIENAEPFAGIVFLVAMGSLVAGRSLPAVPGAWRELLISPFIFVASGVFAGIIADFEDAFDLVGLLRDAGSDTGLVLFVLVIPAVVGWFFYAMFVFSPRQLVERDTEWTTWMLRYGVWFLGTLAGISIAKAL